jgi:HEAT repeat protein
MSHRSSALVALLIVSPPALASAQQAKPKAESTAAAKPVAPAKAAKPKAPPAPKMPIAQATAALAGSDVDQAVLAARSLGAQKGAAALTALLDALAMGVAPDVAEAALGALGAHGDAKAFDTLVVYGNYRAPKVRAAAVAALGALDDKRTDALLIGALHDGHASVRAEAARLVADRKLKKAAKPLVALLKGGDEAAAPALARLADPELAKDVAELIGQAPDGLVARCLGAILMRPDFKPEEARVEVVRALGKVPGDDGLEQLTAYVASVPENPPRQSRREAEALIEAKLGGGK